METSELPNVTVHLRHSCANQSIATLIVQLNDGIDFRQHSPLHTPIGTPFLAPLIDEPMNRGFGKTL